MMKAMNCFIFMMTMLSTLDGTSQAVDTIPAVPCQQVTLATDTSHAIKRKILSDFIDSALREKYFVNNKGIVHLYQYQTSQGDSVWRLYPTIEDEYRDNPPTKFSVFHGDIVLIYDADQQGSAQQNPNPEAFNACLEDVIGNRVYSRPTREDRWTDEVFGKRKMKSGAQRAVIDHAKDQIVVFYKDGTHRVLAPYETL